ncbi:MAG TPA: phosphoribosylaminoimidazolesuccinocarboxamide synthase [Archaeoglobus profundus]|nr:phosphoribosylaminoimidazolesuccinocarboxamide synthase [Archaeoglobus profundus]
MGSVKDLIVLKEPKEDELGLGRFVFSDRYSVFDYGRMPDEIEGKGKALCMITAYFFERLEEEGIKTHYIGIVENGKIKRFDEVESPTNVMEIKLVRVLKPRKVNDHYDYSVFKSVKGNYLIPLEIIYRNSLPEGSSVFKRLERGEITLEQLGLDHYPKPNEKLEKPILDVSTKLEDKDRYITWNEAKEIAGLSEDEVEEIKALTLKINNIITKEVSKAGISNEDGKIEFAFDNDRNLMVIDAVGTPDECRFRYEGTQVSKEVIRKWYRNTEWYKRLENLKSQPNWRELVGEPPKLPTDLLKAVSDMYKACCNEITGRKFFDVDSLKEIIKKINEVIVQS